MRNKIFIYLFLFALLYIFFQYMNEKKIFESQETEIENLGTEIQENEAIIDSLQNRIRDLSYFSLQGNEAAMVYLESMGMEAADTEAMVSDKIYDLNLKDGDNPLVPFEGMEGDMKINKLNFLNHRWIQADFTDGTYWGEMILEYSFTETGELQLNTIASVLFPQ